MTSTMALTQHAEIEFLLLPVRISSYLHSELSQPHCWERDVTKPGGREVENKAEPKLSCHSATGVLTIIGCHHFLIRPVSKKCGNKTALQKEYPRPPPPHAHALLHIHTDNQSCVIYVRTHHTEMCKHIKHVRECYVPTLRIKLDYTVYSELAAFSASAAGISQNARSHKGSARWRCTLTAGGKGILEGNSYIVSILIESGGSQQQAGAVHHLVAFSFLP